MEKSLSRILLAGAVVLAACSDGTLASDTGVSGLDGGAADAGADAAAGDGSVVDVMGIDVAADAPDRDATRDASEADAGEADAGGCNFTGTLEDTFDDVASLSCWDEHNLDHARFSVEGGRLHLRFEDTSPAENGWFGDAQGPALTRRVRGDFLVVTQVDAHRVGEPTEAPEQSYNSAGLLVRDPASRSPDGQNWVMWNTGSQGASNCDVAGPGVSVGSEGKTTVDSASTLCLTEGSHRGRLAICRVGTSVRLLRKLEGDTSWQELHRYDRADFPAELEVGVLGNGWASPPDVHAEFADIRIETIDTADACSPGALEARFP